MPEPVQCKVRIGTDAMQLLFEFFVKVCHLCRLPVLLPNERSLVDFLQPIFQREGSLVLDEELVDKVQTEHGDGATKGTPRGRGIG